MEKLLSVNWIIGAPVCLFATDEITTAGLATRTTAGHVRLFPLQATALLSPRATRDDKRHPFTNDTIRFC